MTTKTPIMRLHVLALSVLASMLMLPSAESATPPSLFLSPSGDDSSPCTASRPCRSVARAYQLARAGQVVRLAAGAYGPQTVRHDPSKTSRNDVVFRGPGARLGWTELYSGHITFEGVHFPEGWRTWNGISDFTFRNTTGKSFKIYGTRQVSVIGGSYGPSHNDYSFIATPSKGAGDPGQILIDRVRFHDYTRSEGAHTECLHVASADGITIRRSRFERCAVMDLFFTLNVNSASAPRNIVLENNFFAPAVGGHFSVLFDKDYDANGASIPWRGLTVRHNSFGQAFTIEQGSNTVSDARVTSNAGEIANCRSGVVYRSNVWRGRSCGSSDKQVANVGFVDPARFDYHLSPRSPAIDAGLRGGHPAIDLDGQARFTGSAPDAGADEAGGRAAARPAPAAPAKADTKAPTRPGQPKVTGRTATSVTLAWPRARDNVSVVRYGIYRGGVRIAQPAQPRFTVTGLACGTRHAFGIDAADRAGNRSARRSVGAATLRCAQPTNTAASGLAAAYSFDEGSGATLRDRSGNGHDGTVRGAAWAPGRHGGALAFADAADLVTVADAAGLDLRSGMTLEAWVKPAPGVGGWRTVLMKEAGDEFSYGLYASSPAGAPAGYSGKARLDSEQGLRPGAWSHLAVTFASGRLRLYVDGRPAGMRAAAAPRPSTGALRIGGNAIWPEESFRGSIDDVRIYSRALSVAEIRADAARPVG